MMSQMRRSSHKPRLTLMIAVPAILLIAGLAWWGLDGRLPGSRSEEAAGPPPLKGVPVIEPASFDADGLALPKKLGSLRFAVIGDAGQIGRASCRERV